MARVAHADDYTADEALHVIQAERSRKSRIALFLFVVSGALTVGAFYLSYRDLPAPPNPANAAPALLDPYR